MGYDCHNYFPKGTRATDVEDFLFLLGYKRGEKGPFSGMIGTPYYFYKDDDYKYITGIYSELYRDKEAKDQLVFWTRTTIWRSKFDSDFHNYTIRQLRNRFGGYFVSDYGKNRYFQYDGPVREKAEAGVYKAFSYFHSNVSRAKHFFSFANLLDDEKHKIQGVDFMDAHNPRILSANVLVPFVVSSVEDFLRSTYIALLRYSSNREKVVQNARLQGAEILAIDQGELTVPEAIAKWMSFQDLNKINNAFKELNVKYDIHGILQRPYGRRRESFWSLLDRLIKQRHVLIHRAELNTDYRPEQLKRDIDLIYKAMWRIYQELVKINKWGLVEEWEF
ncbi:MAG: hypothetical protein AB1469_03855 [Pseudomonadota bacterium]